MAAAEPALAASHDFQSAMPPDCHGSYTCGSLNLAGVDTVTISGTRPAAVIVTQNLSLNDAKIIEGSSAADPALVVQGRLTPATKKGKLRASQAHDRARRSRRNDGAAALQGERQRRHDRPSIGASCSEPA